MEQADGAINGTHLRQRAAALQREACALLHDAGIMEVLRAAFGHVEVVGSVALDLMTWPDVDLYSRLEPHEGARLLAVLPTLHTRLEAHGYGLIRVSFHDEYRRPDSVYGDGLYCGLRVLAPGGEPIWKVDLWGWSEAAFAANIRRHGGLASALASADRDLVLRIKDGASRRPSYKDTVTSVDVYAFALANAGRTIEDFDAFLARRDATDHDSIVS
jgi:hypothetical protein